MNTLNFKQHECFICRNSRSSDWFELERITVSSFCYGIFFHKECFREASCDADQKICREKCSPKQWQELTGIDFINQQICYELEDGSKEWFLNNSRHRVDGPATIRANGSKSWFLHGKRHREDGPAIFWSDGSKFWYFHGELHREDGPAMIWADGSKSWFLHGKQLSKQEHCERISAAAKSKGSS